MFFRYFINIINKNLKLYLFKKNKNILGLYLFKKKIKYYSPKKIIKRLFMYYN